MADAAVEAALKAHEAETQPEPGPTFDGENKFQHAISVWRNLDFTGLTTKLDATATEIVAYQRDSTLQRKELAQKTKDFRKLDDNTKLAEIKGLLKAYQGFIDVLTTHSKAVNSAFLQAYTSLSEVPDPYPLLEASVDSILMSEDTLPKMQEENKHLQKSLSKVTSQLEDAETKLQAERTARKELDDNLESRVKEVESSWTAVLEEKKDNWESREKTLEEKVENQERLLSEMRASYEVNQRLGKSGGDQDAQRGHVSSAEVEMLSSDLERTSVRLAEVEARNEQMRLELAQAKSSLSSQAATSLEDDPGFMRMRSENSSLIRKLDAARVEREATKRDLEGRLRTIERETVLLKEEKEVLKTKVQKWDNYDEIKQELEVLKSIEFSTGDDDEDEDDDGDDEDNDNDSEGLENKATSKRNTLEKLLLARNKKLSDEITIFRVSSQGLQARLEELQEDLSRTNVELEKSQNLNEKLEADLENIQAEGANAFPSGASVAGTYVTRVPPRRGGRASPTSSIISGLDPRGSLGGGEQVYGGGSGILPMVTAQRDRFKKKNAELEQEMSSLNRTVSQLRQEVAALQKDNINLYEKNRYVSTYSRAGASSSINPNPSTVSIGTASSSTAASGTPGMEMDRYRKAYESNISPFAAFRGRESARAYRRMSLPERVVYSITRMVLASRMSRNLFAVYCLALHMLVLTSLYWMGNAAEAGAHGMIVVGTSSGSGVRGKTEHGGWEADTFQG